MLADEEPGLAGCLDRGLLDGCDGGVEFFDGGCGYGDEAGVAEDAVAGGEVGFLLEHVVVLGGLRGVFKHVYFVAETKYSLSSLELRGAEKAKIDCANKLFEKLDQVAGTPGIRYHGVTSYDHLLQLVGA